MARVSKLSVAVVAVGRAAIARACEGPSDPDPVVDSRPPDVVEPTAADWYLNHERWTNAFNCREVARELEGVMLEAFEYLANGYDNPITVSVSQNIRKVMKRVRQELRDYCKGTVKPPVCPSCQNVGQPIIEDRFDTARMDFFSSRATSLARQPGGEWTVVVDGCEYSARSARKAIDSAAKTLDEKLRPSGVVRFKAYVRRYRLPR